MVPEGGPRTWGRALVEAPSSCRQQRLRLPFLGGVVVSDLKQRCILCCP